MFKQNATEIEANGGIDMTLKRRFINDMYNGNYKEYLAARKDDYCKVQLEWSIYIDSLCKDGEITQKQYNSATF